MGVSDPFPLGHGPLMIPQSMQTLPRDIHPKPSISGSQTPRTAAPILAETPSL